MISVRRQFTTVRPTVCSVASDNLVALKLLHISFILICTFGLLGQFYKVSKEYFAYDTNTRIQIKYPDELKIPSLTLCLRYTDLLNLTQLNADRGHNWSTKDTESIRSLQEAITAQEIFNYSPDRYEIVNSAYFRDSTGYSNGSCDDATSCRSSLRISKFIYIEYVCYTIDLVEETLVRPKVISVHPIDTGVLASFSFSSVFYNVTSFKIALHSPFTRPYSSLMIQPISHRALSRKLSMYNAMFHLSPGNFSIKYLKPPYVTWCNDYDADDAYDSQIHCIQTCVRKKVIAEFDKIPYSVFTSSSSERKFISAADVRNKSVAHRLYSIQVECEESDHCKHVACSVRTVITFTLPQAGNRSDFDMTINTPQQPWTYIQHEESLNLITYLTYLMGSFGTWTGISLFGLSPFKQYLKHKTRPHRRVSTCEPLFKSRERKITDAVCTN